MKNHGHKFQPLNLVLGNFQFTIQPETMFRDIANNVESTGKQVPACNIGIRPSKDDLGKAENKRRFLIGNIFLKNFYSVYDYDLQKVGLGVDIHAEGHAFISSFDASKDWKSNEFSQIPEHWKKNLRSNSLD